jgi:tRNA(fMet)-specific endonuclease VapC
MKNRVLIDTDIVLLIQRGNRIVTSHALDYIATFDRLSLTELTWYEIIRGYKISGTYQQLNTFESFCQNCDILSLDRKSLDCAATIYADLRKRGELIGEVDILIAGIAIANGMGIATGNIKHFARIDGLHVENWTL